MADPSASLGKVLANINGDGYTTEGGDRFPRGQCTWYADGRAYEKYKVQLSALLPAPANGGDWFAKIITNAQVTKRAATEGPITDSIAVLSGGSSGDGHVIFIEAVRTDYTYFTEYNFVQAQNGKLQRWPTADFAHVHAGFTLEGYIVLHNLVKLPPITTIDKITVDPETGNIIISGWMANASGNARADFYYDGAHGLASTSTFTDRPDVQKAINASGQYPGGAQFGFTVTIPAGKVPDGNHNFGVAGIGIDGSVQWAYKDATVAAPIPGPLGCIDCPAAGVNISADFPFSGWGIAGAGINSVDISFDDNRAVGSVRAFSSRPDVDKIENPNGFYKDALHSGWTYTIPASLLGKGKHTLRATVVASDGRKASITRDINII